MMLETLGSGVRPWFVTLSYSPDALPQSAEEAMTLAVRFPRYIRRQSLAVRYFMSTELGSLTNRLHHHLIIWCRWTAALSYIRTRERLQKAWKNGYVWADSVKSGSGLAYAAKYAQKDQGKYSWSRFPMLGRPGVEIFERQVLANHSVRPYKSRSTMPAFLRVSVLGKPQEIRVPEPDIERLCSKLGVPYAPVKETDKWLEGGPDCIDFLSGRPSLGSVNN